MPVPALSGFPTIKVIWPRPVSDDVIAETTTGAKAAIAQDVSDDRITKWTKTETTTVWGCSETDMTGEAIVLQTLDALGDLMLVWRKDDARDRWWTALAGLFAPVGLAHSSLWSCRVWGSAYVWLWWPWWRYFLGNGYVSCSKSW